MLIYSMNVSVDGFIADREGAFGWTVPDEEQFRFHIAQTRELGAYLCGRRLYETMLPWETDPSMRDNELWAAFADAWCEIPKVVFSRTLDSVQGNARLAAGSVAEEAGAALEATDKHVGIGGAGLAAAAIELGLVDELRMFRNPVVVGGGTPFLPPVTDDIALDLIETRVDPGDAAATRPDGVHLDAGDADRLALDLDRPRHRRPPVADDADVEARPAHVDRDQVASTELRSVEPGRGGRRRRPRR